MTSLQYAGMEIYELHREMKTLEKRGEKLGSRVKARVDEKIGEAAFLLGEIRKDINETLDLLRGENETLKNIKPLCRQGELFDDNTSPVYDEELFQRCLDSLVETV